VLASFTRAHFLYEASSFPVASPRERCLLRGDRGSLREAETYIRTIAALFLDK
jgi:hypothetical protein